MKKISSSYLLLVCLFICSCFNRLEPKESINLYSLPSIIQDSISSLNQVNKYYYYFDDRIFVHERKDLLFIQFERGIETDALVSEILSYTRLKVLEHNGKNYYPDINGLNFMVLHSDSEDISTDYLVYISNMEGVAAISFMNEYDGQLFASDNLIAAQLKSASDKTAFETLVYQYDGTFLDDQFIDPSIQFVSLPKTSELSTFELAALLYETGLFLFACPNFVYFDIQSTPDLYYPFQWGLKYNNQFPGYTGIDINVEQAWNISQGSGAIVAVIDDGVEVNHPDLSGNVLSGYDFLLDSPGGNPISTQYINDSHGTAIAGIIAAKSNDIGICGVAPSSKILPVRAMSNDNTTGQIISDAISWASTNGADIISCSFRFSLPDPNISSAILNAVTLGRSGKGCIIVASSGNNGGTVGFPARIASVMAVGAVSYDGNRKTYYSPDGESWASSYGSELDISAPGVSIYTLDVQGSFGYNPILSQTYNLLDLSDYSYTKLFGGTSASVPFVSGVAALIISNYPDLSQEQVRRSIEVGSTRPSGYTYYYDDNYPSILRNDEVGCGVVNAYQALIQASWFHAQNIIDNTSGFDFIITNNSSYSLEDIYITLTGKINGIENTLVACDPGDVGSGMRVGYPVYRGENLYSIPGNIITDITLNISAISPEYEGNFHVAATIDNPYPIYYYDFAFGFGNNYQCVLPNSTVPNSERRFLYIDIL